MYTLDELREQNREILELCDVLAVLVEHKHLRNNPHVCALMARFKEKVWIHLVFEDNTIYSELSRHDEASISEVARRFHDSAREIRKRFSSYVRHWCKPEVSEAEFPALLEESREVFGLIRQRVAYENDEMFPLVAQYHAA